MRRSAYSAAEPCTGRLKAWGAVHTRGTARLRGRRSGYVFITWNGDHPPRHVHVYRDGTLIVKWDLDNQQAMRSAATRRILAIHELEAEGVL